MNIEYDRTIQDVIDFNLFHMSHSSSIKRQLLRMQILTVVLVLPLVFSIFYLINHTINIFTLIITILSGILAFVLYPQFSRESTISRIRKMLGEGSNRAMLGHQVVTFSPEGIFRKNQSTESKINWSAVEKVVQSDKHFFLYISSINALEIPKSCLPSEKEQKDFLEYINAHLQQQPGV